MYEVTLIKDIFAVVIHGEGKFIDPRESKERVFVCGSLMSPAFVAGLVGHEICMSPSVAEDFSRGWGESEGNQFHFLYRNPGGMTIGVILLGLSPEDITRLEEFEQAPNVRMRAELEVVCGDTRLPAHTYLKRD